MFHIHTFPELDSTNAYLKAHWSAYKNRDVIVAKRQRNGKGRFDRVWKSDHDLTFSILFYKEAVTPLVVPLAVVKTLEQFHVKASIKWPNDILVEQRKVCGILIERLYEGNQSDVMIVGIGINLNPKQGELKHKTGYINAKPEAMLSAFLSMLDTLLTCSSDVIYEDYCRYHILRGRKIMLDDVLWEIQDVQRDGTLCIRNKEGIRILHGEEITLEQVYEESI